MIKMMMRIVPSDMALSPRRGWDGSAKPQAKRKAYPAVWFQRREPGASLSKPSFRGDANRSAQSAAPLGPSRNDGRSASDGFSLFRLQLQRRRIDAVTQSRRGGAVL